MNDIFDLPDRFDFAETQVRAYYEAIYFGMFDDCKALAEANETGNGWVDFDDVWEDLMKHEEVAEQIASLEDALYDGRLIVMFMEGDEEWGPQWAA